MTGFAAEQHIPRLLIAIGNPLRGDGGLGPVLARCWEAEHGSPAVRTMTVQQLLPEHATDLFGVERVVFLDADDGRPPGEIHCRRVIAGEQRSCPFNHSLAPETLLLLGEALYQHIPEAWLLSIGAQEFPTRESLSPAVRAAFPEALRQLQRLLSPVAAPVPAALR